MLNARLAHVVQVCDAVLFGKGARLRTELCGFDVLIWYKVIHDKCDLVLVENAVYLHFFDLMNGHR